MRIIDADKLKRKMQKIATETWKMKLTGGIRVETIWNQAIDLIDAQPTVNQWIPVSERLPEESGLYQVTDMQGNVVRYVFNVSKSSEEYWRRCVKAWMPLPEPYKGN